MSRYDFAGKGVASSVAIGWDRPLATFFVQVMQPHPRIEGEEATYIWKGAAPGELPTAAAAIAIAAEYADLPEDLGATLETDRLKTLGTFNGPAQEAAKPFIQASPPPIHTEAEAREAGYTRAVVADSTHHTLELLIEPEADLDSIFFAFDRGGNEMLHIHGWNFTIEPE
ncbi:MULTISPECIES: hypothetical protein [Novosphingobium]|uniref:hypothetical protein n=1 Tax=Novosphingobium TaxID=165696 RepID=UPI0022F2866F|nr:hypothetical protein [Novosphingobium resinovorum]GLK44530.1 hypothetical protein GCM10017612_24500 [Novosphingobium resinovorum]